ncbi:MAG TPA: TonB-dependent receptor [Vicinamibacterales bacterium]|nr:TonB-dependent receptor [Vicinamibacterales bacterium]
MFLHRALAVVLALLAAPASWAAQTVGESTAAVDGRVTDSTGAVLENVSVVISGPALMGLRTTATNDDGFYRFPGVPPGRYNLVFTLEGFGEVKRENIPVGIGFTATVDVTLLLAVRQESTTVMGGPPVVDRRSTALVTTFDAGQLQNLPASRSLFAILAATPSIHVARIEVGGNSGAAGGQYAAYGTDGFNRPTVEGMSVSGIFPTGFSLNYGAFEEVSVHTGSHGAEWNMPGVHVQLIGKSGGNRYRGTLYADYENTHWQSVNVDADQIRLVEQGGGDAFRIQDNRLWSYHDVNADAGGYLKPDRAWWYFSFREQEVSARQVNFPVEPLLTRLTNYSGKGTYKLSDGHTVIAFGQAGRNFQPTRLDPSGLTGITANAAINESEESTTRQLAWGWIWKVEWTGIVRNSLFFEARAGAFGSNKPVTPNGSAPRFEDVITSVVSGGHRDWQENLRRGQSSGSFSYFKDGWLGNHQLKAGYEVLRNIASDIFKRAYPGDVLHLLRNGEPSEVFLFQAPSTSASGLWVYGAYASDSWRMKERLTLNLGVRFDRYRVFLPEQTPPAGTFDSASLPAVETLIARNEVVPRLGAAYDLSGDGRTIAKVSYGQYTLPPGTELGFNANPNARQWWSRHRWSDTNRSGVWDAGEEETQPSDSRGGVALESVDPELQLALLREVAGWVEHVLPGDIGIRTGVVWRGERRHFMRQNANRPFDAFSEPVRIQDRGPDNILGTPDDGPSIQAYQLGSEFRGLPIINVVRNVPGADSHYWTWEVTANKRFDRRWSLVAGFSHTWSADQQAVFSGQSVRQNTYPLTPNDLINAGEDGRYDFRIWSAKIHGTYEAPWDVRITPYLRHQSGQPFGRTFLAALNYSPNVRILAEPLGTRRMDNITLFDVRVEKGFRLPGGRRLAGFADVFNVLNANPEQNVIWFSGPSFLRPVTIVPPRIARIGLKVDW